MTRACDADVRTGSGSVQPAKDWLGIDYHNGSHSHIDALCHVAFDEALYNGRPSESLDADGATVTRSRLKDDLAGRGVLLDVPRSRGVSRRAH
jgi:hypothetical protein